MLNDEVRIQMIFIATSQHLAFTCDSNETYDVEIIGWAWRLINSRGLFVFSCCFWLLFMYQTDTVEDPHSHSYDDSKSQGSSVLLWIFINLCPLTWYVGWKTGGCSVNFLILWQSFILLLLFLVDFARNATRKNR